MQVIDGGRLEIWSWALDPDPTTIAQARDLANLAVVRGHVALMADAHAGYGMPIGGVILAESAVIPYAVGVDIGCGVALARTDLVWGESLGPDELRAVLHQLARDVPTGFEVHETAPLTIEGMADAVGADPPPGIDRRWLDRADRSLGTLGGGNHFLEIQGDPAGRVHFMLHSGSRNLGKRICDAFVREARDACRRSGRELPNRDLAYLRFDEDPAAEAYWGAMRWAMAWAELNRRLMLDRAEEAFRRHTRIGAFERLGDVHHNFAELERHGGLSGYVHRKGAVRAGGGETVFLPGSMGTASYVGEGLGSAAAFASCPHGAGRALGRKEAMRRKSSAQVVDEMAELGVAFVSGEPRSAAEEAPFAYKDIESVVTASADLFRPTLRLVPLGVVKG